MATRIEVETQANKKSTQKSAKFLFYGTTSIA